MELSLIKTLMNKDFYEDHKGAKCPDRLFSKEVRKIKATIDKAMLQYDRTVTTDEIQALFLSSNPSLTTAQKQAYESMFLTLKKETELGKDIAQEVLSKLFQQIVGEDIANIGFNYVNGTQSTLEPLRNILDSYGDDFIPNLNVDWEDLSIENLIKSNDLETRWSFNIPSLVHQLEGVNEGHLIEVGARPNTGKTSFHASLIASPTGFAHQGARCVVLCNEEKAVRVGARYLTAAVGMNMHEIRDKPSQAHELWKKVEKNVSIKDATSKDMNWVESICKAYKPDVLVLDMGDKFATTQGFARQDEALKANAIHARQIGKAYNCAVFYMSQLSAEAEGKVLLNQSMMEGSRTGKAAEADVMILIAKNPPVEGQDGEDSVRHLNIVKNKITGWHGKIICDLDYKLARYQA
jgi:hypothetical protein|tara:strand:- start:1163 stop:2386 length:1224 start_codon:yes stop_codon:yes gene_type:complete